MSDEENKMIFSKNLQHYANLRSLQQNEIASICNVTPAAVNSWFLGQKMPRMDKIQKLANYFGINKSDLIEKRTDIENKATVTKEEIKFALFNGSEGITDEMYEEVKNFAEMVKLREAYKGKK